jgi:predicted SAM-dependent methyltransferase
MYAKFKQFVYWKLVPIIKIWKLLSWKYYLNTNDSINLIAGAGPFKFKGWFPTDIATLDVTNENHFQKYFKDKKINKILAEHVLEHLTNEELELMVNHLYKYSADDINIRIAVPDGFHKDEKYIQTVKPGGTGIGADDHKHLFNYKTLSSIFERKGFVPYPKEYWDENGEFHTSYSNDEFGTIRRSFINDERNKDKLPQYTSLIVDFKKK